MTCFSCGKKIPNNVVICPECGSNLVKDQIKDINDYCEKEIEKLIKEREEIADKA